MKKIGIGFLIILLLAVAFFAGRFSAGTMEKPSEAVEEPENKAEENQKKTEEDEEAVKGEADKNHEKNAEDEELAMEIRGITDEQLELLGVTKKELASALKTWSMENGYSSAIGAEFQDNMSIRFSEKKYSTDCRLIFGNEGNGIREETENVLISVNYYRDKNVLCIHK